MLGLPSLHTGHWDPLMRGVRGDRHRRVPARRLVGHVAVDLGRRAARRHRRAVLRLRDVRRGRLALLADPGALPRHPHLPVRGRHRLGGRRCSTGSTTCSATTRCTARGTASSSRRPRCCGATSGSARSTTRRRSCCASASASTTSWSSPTTRTPTRRGRTRRRVIEREIGGLPPDDIRRITWENASRAVPPPGAARGAGRPERVLMAAEPPGGAARSQNRIGEAGASSERQRAPELESIGDDRRAGRPPSACRSRGSGVRERARAAHVGGLRPAWSDRARGRPRGGGLRPGDRVAVQMARRTWRARRVRGAARRRAGGGGHRRRGPGPREVDHLMTRTGARYLHHGRRPAQRRDGGPPRQGWLAAERLFLLNSTSGTTGLPKVVMHDQQRWFAFHELARRRRRARPRTTCS